MENGLFKIEGEQVKAAIVYGVVAMVCGAVLAVGNYVLDAGTIFGLDWKMIVDKGALAALGAFVTAVTFIASLLTTKKGNFLGAVKVVPDKKY